MCKFICSALTEIKSDLPKLPWRITKIVGFAMIVYVFSLSYWGNLARCHIFDRDGCKPHLKISFSTPKSVDRGAVGDYSLFPGINLAEYPNVIAVTIDVADAGVGDLTEAYLTPSLQCDCDCGRVLGFQYGSGEPQTSKALNTKIEISHARLGNPGYWSKQYGEIDLLLGAFDGKSLDNARLAVSVNCKICQIEDFSTSLLIDPKGS